MDTRGSCPDSGSGSAEDIPKNLPEQKTSQEKLFGFEDGKNVANALEKPYNQEKMDYELSAKPDSIVNSDCDTRFAIKPSDSTVLAETRSNEHHPSSSPKNAPSQSPVPDAEHSSASFYASFGQLPAPKVTRCSLSRNSLKQDSNHRRSLPPLHPDVSDLCKDIRLDLPEAERMAALLLSSFQYSARKLEHSLRQTEDFNPESFEQNVSLLSEELELYTKKLILDGTLHKCCEDPRGDLSDPVLSASVAALKENILRFSTESEAWDDLLQTYKKNAEETARQLEQHELKQAPEESSSYHSSSQAHVIKAKPDYQKILDGQGEAFHDMERVLDEIHQMVKVCQTYTEDVTQYLQKLTSSIASKTFNNLEKSPARKLLKLWTKPDTPSPSEG